MNSTVFLNTLGLGISAGLNNRRGVESPYHLKTQRQWKPCIILTDLAHEVINLHVDMIHRTHIMPAPGNENNSYTTE